MNIQEYITHVESGVKNTVADAVRYSVKELKQRTPGNRVKTRRAIHGKARGNRGTVGLRFSRKYPTAGTRTLKDLKRNWREIRPTVRKRIINQLSEILKG